MEMNSAGLQITDIGTAGVTVRPPFLFLAALLLGFVLDHLLPWSFSLARTGSLHWISAFIAGTLILTGIAVFAAGIRNFSRAATPVQGTKPTRNAGNDWNSRLESQSHLSRHVSRLRRHRLSRRQPVDPDARATARNNDPLRRRGARGGVPGTAVRRLPPSRPPGGRTKKETTGPLPTPGN